VGVDFLSSFFSAGFGVGVSFFAVPHQLLEDFSEDGFLSRQVLT